MAESRSVRRDPVSGREVVFASHRRNRPQIRVTPAAPCPFCPGNEALLPDILWQRDEDGAWLSRATPNRYPIVSPPDGHHEVIIETPRHSRPVAKMTADDWGDVLWAYDARYRALSADWKHLSLFRNAGPRAGGSIPHPHSQLIALARTPASIASRHRRLCQSHRTTGDCVLCDAVAGRIENGKGIVARSASFVTLVPEVPEVPFEVWVVPMAHSSLFAFADESDRQNLAGVLADVFHRMCGVLGDFDHNMMLMDAAQEPRPYLHWHLRIRPIAETVGGFELSTGISVNPSSPDQDADRLRSAGAAPATVQS